MWESIGHRTQRGDRRTDGQTDGRTNGPTDKAGFLCCMHSTKNYHWHFPDTKQSINETITGSRFYSLNSTINNKKYTFPITKKSSAGRTLTEEKPHTNNSHKTLTRGAFHLLNRNNNDNHNVTLSEPQNSLLKKLSYQIFCQMSDVHIVCIVHLHLHIGIKNSFFIA